MLKDYFDPGQLSAFMRHVYSALGGATAMALAMGLSQGDATTIGTAVHQIGDGIVSIATGVAALVPVVSAVYAAISASRKSRLVAMDADPQIKKVETVAGTPAAAIAAEIPGPKVVSVPAPAPPGKAA